MPFAKAVAVLASFTHTQVSEASAQRLTESVGLAYEAVQLAEVEHIEQDWPEVEAGPDKLVLSVDGAFVPLVHGEWAEVKTLVVGEVGEPKLVDGQQVVVPRRSPPGAAAAIPGAPGSGAKVSLASATLDQLDELPGIGPVTAQKILDWRTTHGPFRSVDDLDDVPGIGPARIEQLRDLVTP